MLAYWQQVRKEQGLAGDFGWMLYDMDFSRPADPRPMFFRAQLARGVLDLTKAEVRS